jgi:hypothetical protein
VRKRIHIEELLRWAYREELPKQTVGGVTGWERAILLGTAIDEAPIHPKLPVAVGPSHPDALRIEWRVRQLEEVRVKWSWVRKHLMPDLAPYLTGQDTAVMSVAGMVSPRRARVEHYVVEQLAFTTSVRALVEMHARLGKSPAWDLGPVALRRVQTSNNKPKVVALDGSGRTRDAGGRLLWGTACELKLDPAAEDIAEARWEHLVWHVALNQLTYELARELEAHEPLPPRAVQMPWLADVPRETSRKVSIPLTSMTSRC